METLNNTYCNNLLNYSRLKTRTVTIGNYPLGSNYPIRIQSMTNTNTLAINATVEQSERLINIGCEYVRVTASTMDEAKCLLEIKKRLRAKGIDNPIIADIHFNPQVAEFIAPHIEKIRINPGNFADKKTFKQLDYSKTEYNDELERIYNRFSPLVKICRTHGTAMRIGVNHGSLSDRIMSRYGDTPKGMVEAALEFIKICESLNYYNIVLSMKASNVRVMVYAYRLLVNQMLKLGMNYPLHLGVTEAGEGEDGRIKSAIGIGTLLDDGIGDTIRVSLTENPENEIPVALAITEKYRLQSIVKSQKSAVRSPQFHPFSYNKRNTEVVGIIGGSNHPIVVLNYSSTDFSNLLNKPDFLYIGKNNIPTSVIPIIQDYQCWQKVNKNHFPLFKISEYLANPAKSDTLNFIRVNSQEINNNFITTIKQDKTAILILETHTQHSIAEQRQLYLKLLEYDCKTPVINKRVYNTPDYNSLQISAATDFGSALTDGFGNGIWIENTQSHPEQLLNLSFSILQITKTRITRSEYISCPTCGRTSYDILKVLAEIKEKTNHLKGLKIAVMGCIVNGPGEMADADYGYVGTATGKVNLYYGKILVKNNIESSLAMEELITLIKQNNQWVESEIIVNKTN